MSDAHLIDRRSVLTKVIPGAALAGISLLGATALAQEKAPTGTVPKTPETGKDVIRDMLTQSFSNGEYRLPKLPYGYEALEPHISTRHMQIHHDKHHQGYVNNLNKTVKSLSDLQASREIDMARLSGLEKDLSFNAGGHVLHTLFWATMAPETGGQPKGALAEAINTDFTSFDVFKNYFSKTASGVKGSGWALLAYEPIGDRLMAFQVNDHDLKLSPGIQPLLPLDVWEHAYYLQYENNRDKFIEAWWNVVNWPAVNAYYEGVRSRFSKKEA